MNVRCRCADPGCPVHMGASDCLFDASARLYRVDTEDHSGTPMCEACAADAMRSGLFTEWSEFSGRA